MKTNDFLKALAEYLEDEHQYLCDVQCAHADINTTVTQLQINLFGLMLDKRHPQAAVYMWLWPGDFIVRATSAFDFRSNEVHHSVADIREPDSIQQITRWLDYQRDMANHYYRRAKNV